MILGGGIDCRFFYVFVFVLFCTVLYCFRLFCTFLYCFVLNLTTVFFLSHSLRHDLQEKKRKKMNIVGGQIKLNSKDFLVFGGFVLLIVLAALFVWNYFGIGKEIRQLKSLATTSARNSAVAANTSAQTQQAVAVGAVEIPADVTIKSASDVKDTTATDSETKDE